MHKSNILSPELQWIRLRSCPISLGHGYVHRGELTWDFTASPSPFGRSYKLRISYKRGKLPNVYVLSPNLNMLAEGKPLPHVYSTKPIRLCLHHPKLNEWSPDKSITETIIPWAYLWLFYFEQWLINYEWQGGGKHPGDE